VKGNDISTAKYSGIIQCAHEQLERSWDLMLNLKRKRSKRWSKNKRGKRRIDEFGRGCKSPLIKNYYESKSKNKI
jgi:hypothetical protein